MAISPNSNAKTSPGLAKLVTALQDSGATVIVAALRNPYDIAEVPQASTYLASYSTKTVSLTSLVKVITGEVAPQGKLPVDIPAADGSMLYERGAGLTW